MKTSRFLVSRRSVMLGGAATILASSCAARMMPASAMSDGLEGKEIYSESVQMSGSSPDSEYMFSIRLCQYPDINVAWVWASVLTPEGNYLFADNFVPWTGQAAGAATASEASYVATLGNMRIKFDRSGQHGAITKGRLTFEYTGDRPFGVGAKFIPSAGYTGLLEGRSEMFGNVEAEILTGDQRHHFSGFGQWHEQPQNDPRFVVPFVYSSLWGAAASATLLQTPDGSGGYCLRPDHAPLVFQSAHFSPSGSVRNIVLNAGDQEQIELNFRQLHIYTLPIYGKAWQGTFVSGELFGEPVHGFINNWMM